MRDALREEASWFLDPLAWVFLLLGLGMIVVAFRGHVPEGAGFPRITLVLITILSVIGAFVTIPIDIKFSTGLGLMAIAMLIVYRRTGAPGRQD